MLRTIINDRDIKDMWIYVPIIVITKMFQWNMSDYLYAMIEVNLKNIN